MMLSLKQISVCLIITGLIAGCSTAPRQTSVIKDGPPKQLVDINAIKDAKPKYEPYSKYGNPPSYVVFNKRYFTRTSAVGFKQTGIASWYGSKFHGQRTSSGETYDMLAMTAAHTSLPLPTYAKVTNLANNRSVIVKINDRGPFHDNRIIDLSYAAAVKLGYADQGTAEVQIETITFPQHKVAMKQKAQTQEQSTQHYIQVGAFRNRHSAEQLKTRLKSVHQSARITHDAKKQLPLYRVRLGPFNSRDEATQLAMVVDNIGLKPFIVTE